MGAKRGNTDMLKDVFKKQVQAGDEVVLLVKEYGYRKMSDSYLGNAIYIGEGPYGHEFISKDRLGAWLKDPESIKQPLRQKKPECVLIEKAKPKTRTYYITVERQGYTLAVVKVEAESYDEAERKALLALHANDDIEELTKEQARAIVKSEDGLYMIDENGDEVDLDEEDD